jgi:hypothetical protein
VEKLPEPPSMDEVGTGLMSVDEFAAVFAALPIDDLLTSTEAGAEKGKP